MTVSEFELIVLEDGDVGLQRAGADDLLVRVKFSPRIKEYLGEQQVEVAKCMINTGIKTFFELEQSASSGADSKSDPTVH